MPSGTKSGLYFSLIRAPPQAAAAPLHCRWLLPPPAATSAQRMATLLTPARRGILRRTFQKLDTDFDGKLSITELRKGFSGNWDSRVTGGEITETQSFNEFVAELGRDGCIVEHDGSQFVLDNEWNEYFASKFGALEDDAFCAKISKMWGTPFVTQRKLDGLEATLLDSLSAQGGEREVLTRIFKKYDSNADGLLQFDEFERFVENFGIVNKPQDEVRALFERYDSDDSGALAFSEFSAAMLRQVEGHRPR